MRDELIKMSFLARSKKVVERDTYLRYDRTNAHRVIIALVIVIIIKYVPLL